jgi:hypothetical protein
VDRGLYGLMRLLMRCGAVAGIRAVVP